MGLTVSHKSVENPAIRRKKSDKLEPFFSLQQWVIKCYSGLAAAEKWPKF